MGEWRYGSTILDLGRFTPGIHWIGGWVGRRVGLDAVKKRNILSLPGLKRSRET
jgi:hypothetical protein